MKRRARSGHGVDAGRVERERNLLRSVMDAMPDPIYVKDRQGRTLVANVAQALSLGFAGPADLVGKTDAELHYPEDALQAIRRNDLAVMEAGEPINLEELWVGPRGEKRWMSTTRAPLRDAGGLVVGVVGISRDITDRKLAEETLRDLFDLSQKLVATPSVGIAVYTAAGQCILANQAMAAASGATLEQVLQQDFRRLVSWQRTGLLAMADEVLASGSERRADVHMRTSFGREGWFDTHLARFVSRGEPHLLVTAHDITERKRAEKALEAGERLLLALSEAAQAVQRAHSRAEVFALVGDLIVGLGYRAIVFDMSEDRSHLAVRYLSAGGELARQAGEILGSSPEGFRFPIRPGSLHERMIRDGRAAFFDDARVPMQEGAPAPVVDRIAALLGMQEAILAPLRVHGEVQGLLAIAGQGLTRADLPAVAAFANQAAIAIENAHLMETVNRHDAELQRLSARLIRAQEAERQHIARELHDEMGQALTAIAINLAALKKHIGPAAGEGDLDRLAETSALVARTLEQVRELSLDLRPSMLDELGLAPTLRWYTRRWAERLNVEVQLEATGLEETFRGEAATALYRIVQEALTNVARHAQAGRVRIRLERQPGQVAARIEDDGRGFDPREVNDREGTARGAGLLGIRERVGALGGRFEIDSCPGGGARLTVEIPLPAGGNGGAP